MPKKTKRFYSGILAEPVAPSVDIDPNDPHPVYLDRGYSATQWRDAVEKRNRLRSDGIEARWSALHEHFGLTPGAPGADKDLALSLAWRHEREVLVQGNRICLAALCERENLNPENSGVERELARKLFYKHVLVEEPPKTPGPREWSTYELHALCLLTWKIAINLQPKMPKAASARRVADVLLNKAELVKFFHADIGRITDQDPDELDAVSLANEVHELFRETREQEEGIRAA